MAEEKSYDEDLFNDVKAAVSGDEPEKEVVEPEKVEAEPEKAEKVEQRDDGRNEKGQFVAKEKDDPEPKLRSGVTEITDPVQKEAAQKLIAESQAQAAPKIAPPPGFSIKSKSDWDKLPQHVKDDIAKREDEVSRGFSEYAGLKPFAERAKSSGQSLQQVLTSYVNMEDLLRRDPASGLLTLAQNMGLTQAEAGQLYANMAQRLGYRFAEAGQQQPGSMVDQNTGAATDPNALQAMLGQTLNPLTQRLNSIEQAVTQQMQAHQQRQLSTAEQTIETFRTNPENKYFANLEPVIEGLLNSSMIPKSGDMAADLKAAYDMACWQNPEIREALINERAAAGNGQATVQAQAAAKAKAASRSITGSPSGDESPTRKRALGQSYDDDLYEDVKAAFSQSSAAA